MKKIIDWEPEQKIAVVFFSGFLLGIACSLISMPYHADEKTEEYILEYDGEVNEELDTEIKDYISYLSKKYGIKKIRVEITEGGKDG